MQHHHVLHAGLAAELERGLVVLAEPAIGRPASLVVDADRLLRLCAGALRFVCAFEAFGVKERCGADHHDREREIRAAACRPRPVEISRQIAGASQTSGPWLVGASNMPRSGPWQRRISASATSRSSRARPPGSCRARWRCSPRGRAAARRRGRCRPRRRAVRRRRRGLDEPERLGLGERPVEHRARDRLQQPLAHLGRADPRERVQPRLPAGRERRLTPPSA